MLLLYLFQNFPKPVCLPDFRPITVTPIMSRLANKLIVQKSLLPAINHQTMNNQFAFRPTGSTKCALVFYALCHLVARLLETNSYVSCLLIYFSKTFSLTMHILAAKLTGLNMQPASLSWIFLSLLAGPSRLNMAFTCRHGNLLTVVL